MNPKLFEILTANPDKFPKSLSKLYPRVLEKISNAWGTDALDDLFAELLVADHEGRQGFPPDVGREIFALNQLNEQYKLHAVDPDDPWAMERDMSVEETAAFVDSLQESGREFTPETLFKLVEQGETHLAFDFMRAGMQVDLRRTDEWTPLMVALFNGHEETAMMLLSRGANVRAKANRGYEPIHWAALNGYERAVKFIIDKGGNVNAETEYGWTPLLQAASRGHVEIARMLLDKGAMVNASEHEGWTPLHKACANGLVEMVRLLVQRGADTRQRSVSGITPLELGIKAQDFDLIEALSEEVPPPAAASTSPFDLHRK
ncbi:MAG: ankyrin repeat domain-containing protein [Burkholderiales bacterium]|nr:ankyrin repeat domain-containing protein [Burkholderiales bacterium]